MEGQDAFVFMNLSNSDDANEAVNSMDCRVCWCWGYTLWMLGWGY